MFGALVGLVTRLALLGGVAAGGFLIYRRLTVTTMPSELGAAPAAPLPIEPIPPQNIRDLLPILACPRCKGPLSLNADDTELICAQCQIAYAIEDGIPVLLPDSGRPLSGTSGS